MFCRAGLGLPAVPSSCKCPQNIVDSSIVKKSKATLAGTPSQAAALVQAQAVLKDVGLPNSYTLTKHMAEGLVADMHAAGVLPSAIVRPSIVSCIARAPAPGYFGNSAGLTSIVLVYASGERQGS